MQLNKKKIFKCVMTLFVIPLLAYSQSANKANDIEVLCSKRTVQDLKMNGSFISALDITSQRHILLADDHQFYLLGWGGISPVGQKVQGLIRSFTYTTDSLLMFIQDNRLCGFDKVGNVITLYNIPSSMNKMTRGKYGIYFYSNDKNSVDYPVLFITKGGGYKKMFSLPTPIESIVENGTTLYIASKNAVFTFDIVTQKLAVFTSLTGNNPLIKSIAINPKNQQVFFSTDSLVFAFNNNKITIVSGIMGGLISYFSDGIIIFDTKQPLMIRMTAISETVDKAKPFQQTALASKVMLNNQSVIKMISDKQTDESIIKTIETATDVQFDTSVDGMVDLSNHGVSSDVILAMKKAMKKKNSK